MRKRSRAREVAFQLLFQRDLHPRFTQDLCEELANDRISVPGLVTFCLELYEGTQANLPLIDQQLHRCASNWKLSRMSTVDRNVMRLAAYEMLFTETPPKVVLNEAIELSRRFGAERSPRFVNGVLDRLLKDQQAPIATEAKED